MSDEAFSYPFMYWNGLNTPADPQPGELVEFNRFYNHVHVPEVVAGNPGFTRGTRYELLQPDRRGNLGPRWLAMYEMQDETAAQGYAARNDALSGDRPNFSPGPPLWDRKTGMWRMIWRRMNSRGTAPRPPYSIFMVGMNVPPDTDADELAAFNEFYTNTHVPEVMAAGHYARATRFELFRAFAHPDPGSPRFCAIYEADAAVTEATLQQRASGTQTGGLSSGPPAWERHETLWRLVYRRIDPAVEPD